MANLILPSNVIRWYDIVTRDEAGNIEAQPPGDTFAATSSDPAKLAASVGENPQSHHQAVRLNALVDEADASVGLFFTVSDTAGLKAYTKGVEISDVTPAFQIGIDETHPFDETQAEPPPAA